MRSKRDVKNLEESTIGGEKKSSIIDDLRKFNGFRVSKTAQNNSTFNKFCNLFEGMDDDDDENEQ